MFVQVFQGSISDPETMRARFDAWMEELAPGADGWLGMTGGVTEDGELVAAVRFESEEAARRNSDRPEQGEWWSETEQLFDGPVTFHDHPHTALFLGGGSDDAGFVQVIQGRSDRPEELRMDPSDEETLASVRPEIIGGLLAWSDDGSFTDVVYFTSEEEARKGERDTEDHPELRAAQEGWMELMEDVRFLDLREPWLYSP